MRFEGVIVSNSRTQLLLLRSVAFLYIRLPRMANWRHIVNPCLRLGAYWR